MFLLCVPTRPNTSSCCVTTKTPVEQQSLSFHKRALCSTVTVHRPTRRRSGQVGTELVLPGLGELGWWGGASPPIFLFSNSSWYLICRGRTKTQKHQETDGKCVSQIHEHQSVVLSLATRGLPLLRAHRWGSFEQL